MSPNWIITGQVEMVPTGSSGVLIADEPGDAQHDPIFLTEGRTLSVRLSSAFVREIQEVGGAEFMVYAEIYDVQPDDQQRLVKVLFKESNQSSGYLLNVKDRLVFGPIEYKGNPLRIRLFIVELDKEDNEVAARLIRTAAQLASSLVPTAAPVAGLATSVGDLFLQLNPDDMELVYDFTLYPKSHSAGPYLKSGSYVLVKTENRLRGNPGIALTEADRKAYVKQRTSYETDFGRTLDAQGQPVKNTIEDYAALFTYEDYEGHPLSSQGPVRRYNVLRVMDGQLWLQCVALEWNGRIVLADKSLNIETDPLFADKAGKPPFKVPGPKGTHDMAQVRTYTLGGLPQSELLLWEGGDLNKEPKEIRLSRRVQYREKTHAVLTVAEGGIPSEREVFERLSVEDEKAIAAALQPQLTAEQISKRLDEVQERFVGILVHKQVVKQANKSVAKQDRAKPAFVLAYLRQLSTVDAEARPDKEQAALAWDEQVARNKAIIEIVSSMVTGFPHTLAQASTNAEITKMKGYTAKNFVPNNPPDPDKPEVGDGTYTFTADGGGGQ